MTQEDKELLLKDLGSRLAYHPVIYGKEGISTNEGVLTSVMTSGVLINTKGGSTHHYFLEEIKPYLRPLGSMTKDEARFILRKIVGDREILSVDIGRDEITANVDDGVSSYEKVWVFYDEIVRSLDLLDYLNARYFDYRGLIEKGLAIEAPDGMYNTKTELL